MNPEQIATLAIDVAAILAYVPKSLRILVMSKADEICNTVDKIAKDIENGT